MNCVKNLLSFFLIKYIKIMGTKKETLDQTDQLSLMRKNLKPILEYDEIPRDAIYYLKQKTEDSHWVYLRYYLIGMKDDTLWFRDEQGITRPFNYDELENTYFHENTYA